MSKPSIGVLHRLAPGHRASTPGVVAGAFGGVHSTAQASVHLAAATRTAGAGAWLDDGAVAVKPRSLEPLQGGLVS